MAHVGAGSDRLVAKPDDRSRRRFVARSTVIGLAAVTRGAGAAEPNVVERDVTIQTPDGVCDAAFVHPSSGAHPGVLIWPDVFGLRPVFREMGKRLAAQGYSVLIPNPFYRTDKPPVVADVSSFDFQAPANMAKVRQLIDSISGAGIAESDAKSYVGYLRVQGQVDSKKKIGVQGYCMGGPLTIRTAAALADQVGAAASFHGGGLVTDKDSSPHLLAPRIRARVLIAIAASDDARQPDAKDRLREAFGAARVPAEVEVFPQTLHGWCVADMPTRDGKPIYNKPEAERAWTKLLALYRESLA
jgi:carboxymethylenebutenolidase